MLPEPKRTMQADEASSSTLLLGLGGGGRVTVIIIEIMKEAESCSPDY